MLGLGEVPGEGLGKGPELGGLLLGTKAQMASDQFNPALGTQDGSDRANRLNIWPALETYSS